MSSVFSGALLSFLATPSNVEVVRNFKELSEAVEKGTHSAYSAKGTLAVPLLLKSKESHLRQLGRMIEENNWYLRPEDVLNNPMKSIESILIGSSEYLRFLYGTHPKVLIAEENDYAISFAFLIRKGFCCSSQLRKVMSRMASAGIYDRYFKLEPFKYFLSGHTNEEKIEKISSLSLKDLFSSFSILLAGLGVSLLIFIGEIVVANYNT
ncbi:lig_chan-Glu_bd domain-containing protein [Trichonephila clavata]|uniref:Lig_chan-Glu_bd domain-containing protein n=1 Tax=Trichonephila clavata TaxID=2740835 RepID=A0A8X6HL76_TRICU|nr:lig_chan-Glu_bd domain-containing protein [Trichonephila clavata]